MQRFFQSDAASPRITLAGEEAHHALRVLRVRLGERVDVLNGAGACHHCTVDSVQKNTLDLAVIETVQTPALPWRITLFLAVPKGKTMDAVIQKATELGVSRIVPVLSERAIPHLDQEAVGHKQEKWQQIAIEAVKQCGQTWLPHVESPSSWNAAIQRMPVGELDLVASLLPGSVHARQGFTDFFSSQGHKPTTLSLWIGPEGDLTPAEVESLLARGAKPITLGRLVLRVETAVISALSVLNHELSA
jgi:16S rRNA (uracil1498-N3)-methyltransferase